MNRALIIPNWPKWQSLNPCNFTKMITGKIIFSNLGSGQQYLSNDIKKFHQNGQLKSQNLSEEKKPTPSTNIPLLSYRKLKQQDTKHYFNAYSVSTETKFWIYTTNAETYENIQKYICLFHFRLYPKIHML